MTLCVGIRDTDLLGYYFPRRENGQGGRIHSVVVAFGKRKKRLAQIPDANAVGMPYLNFPWAKVKSMYACYTTELDGFPSLFSFSFPSERKAQKRLACS